MEKAYDRLDWQSIKKCFTDFGFVDKWINWVIECITTTPFFIMINGIPREYLDQRNQTRRPYISIYIYYFSEYLGRYFHYRTTIPKTGIGIKTVKNGYAIPYLMCADDRIIFYKASKVAARNIKENLHNYCMVSGQLVNFYKSLILFSKGVPKNVKLDIANILQILFSSSIGTYLGCRNIDRKRTSRDDFIHIKENITNKLAGWKARVLCHAGKTILIKSNLTGISSFMMQWVKIPNYIAKELDFVIWIFSGITTWDQVILMELYRLSPRTKFLDQSEGGLDIRNVQDVNAMFLTKLGWKILKDPNNLWVKVTFVKYLSKNRFLDVRKTANASTIWMYSIIGIFSRGESNGA